MIRVVLADDQTAGARRVPHAARRRGRHRGGRRGGRRGTRRVARVVARPDVVLMDIRMPGIDGLEACGASTRPGLAGVKVLVLTTFELDEYVFEALRPGAGGFLVKHTQPADLVRAVREVAAGEALLSPSVTRRLIRSSPRAEPRRGRQPPRSTGADRSRARGRRPRGAGPDQRRDRHAAGREPGDRADPRQPGDDQAATPATAPSSSCSPTRPASSRRLT